LKISVKTDDTIHITAENIDMEIPFVTAFGDVQKGEALAYINSEGTLAFAINQGNFADTYGLKEGMEITVKKGQGDG